MIALQGIKKTFGRGQTAGIDVLEGIDVQARAGELVAILGPSGCGKSTLLRIAAGLEAPDSGTVLFTDGGTAERGFMFQDARLLPWLTVEDNVLFPLHGPPSPEVRARAHRLLELVGLTGFAHTYPHQLSGGMAQRAAIARALLLAPTILFLDEPFGALDWMTKVRLQDELKRLEDFRRAATLLVTHDIEEAVFLATRVVVLSQRPAQVRAVIPIDLPEPRDRSERRFNDLRKAVYDACFGPQRHPDTAVAI